MDIENFSFSERPKNELTFFELLNNTKNLAIFIAGIIIIFSTIALNMFIIIVVIVDKSMRNYTNIQFAFMSCSDLLVGMIAMPSLLISIIYNYWPLGRWFCVLWCIGDFVGGNLSILVLTIITYHRLQCIRKPFIAKKSMFESLVPFLIIAPINFTFWALPIFHAVNNANDNVNSFTLMNSNECFFTYSFEYVLAVDLLAYIFPICLLIFLQFSIYINLKNKNSLINPAFQKQKTTLSLEDKSTITLRNIPKFNKDLVDKRKALQSKSNQFLTNVEVVVKKRKSSLDENYCNHVNILRPGVELQIIEGVATDTRGSVSSTTNYKEFLKDFKERSKFQKLGSFNRKDPNLRLNKTTHTNKNSNSTQSSLSHLTNNFNKNRKVFRTLFSVTCSLVIFWLPWIMLWPIDAYCNCVPKSLYIISYCMEYLNSLINSILLVVGNQHFRKKFLSLFLNR